MIGHRRDDEDEDQVDDVVYGNCSAGAGSSAGTVGSNSAGSAGLGSNGAKTQPSVGFVHGGHV